MSRRCQPSLGNLFVPKLKFFFHCRQRPIAARDNYKLNIDKVNYKLISLCASSSFQQLKV